MEPEIFSDTGDPDNNVQDKQSKIMKRINANGFVSIEAFVYYYGFTSLEEMESHLDLDRG